MDWHAVTILRKNIKQLSKSTKNSVQEKFPDRTTEFKKCIRDMSYILQAISTCIQSNDTTAIDHVIKMFYLGGTLRLKYIHAELYAYDILKDKIYDLFDTNNISNESKDIVCNCIELLKYHIENGYDEPVTQWDNRRNYKVYDNNFVIPTSFQSKAETILQNCPLQNCGHNRFSILKLLPSDLEIKEFLFKNFFLNDNTNFHEAAIVTCPIIYLAMPRPEDTALMLDKTSYQWESKLTAIGIHGGALLNETLNAGYDFSYIGCTTEKLKKGVTSQWIKICKNRWNFSTSSDNSWPVVAMCIGKGIRDSESEKKYTCLNGETFSYISTANKIDLIKENIIYE